MQHQMKLLPGPFEKIKFGFKIIEIRLFDEKRQQIQVGDTIEFSLLPDLTEKIFVEVTGLLRYASFRDLIVGCGMEPFGYLREYPQEDFLQSIYTIYSKEDEEKYGVLGIQIKLCN